MVYKVTNNKSVEHLFSGWQETLIEQFYPEAKKVTRYAIRKNTAFDREKLKSYAANVPDGYVMQPIDGELYDRCFLHPQTADFVSVFETKERFLQLGRGVVITKDGQIVAGASSYTRYIEGIEIEVDTLPDYRRQHLAQCACAALIRAVWRRGCTPAGTPRIWHPWRSVKRWGIGFPMRTPPMRSNSTKAPLSLGRCFCISTKCQLAPKRKR